MDKHYNYREEYSGQNITDKSLSVVRDMLDALERSLWYDKAEDSRMGFGLGCVQWTFERTSLLLEVYKEVANGSDTITFEQVKQAEGLMVIRELTEIPRYKTIYPDWKATNQGNLDSEKSASSAGDLICRRYEEPAYPDIEAPIRELDAQRIYNVMKGR